MKGGRDGQMVRMKEMRKLIHNLSCKI